MIIQCKQCEAKFRFDEAIISGEGVWVRCSICKNIFFQDNPCKAERASVPPEKATKDRGPAGLAGEPVVVTERPARIEVLSPESRKAENAGMVPAAEPEESVQDDEGDLMPERRGKGMGIGKVVAYLLLIVLVSGGIYLWVGSPFGVRGPATGVGGGQALMEWVTSLPLVDKILAVGGQQKDFSLTQVTIQDLKQRVVKNMLLGDLHVIEGTALNQSEYVISRIQVRGRIYDAGGAVLGERISSCGDILTDEELASMTEDAIQKVLSLSLGRNVLNDRIAANSQIPFMIVFANVPPAAVKTTVSPVGAERLLP